MPMPPIEFHVAMFRGEWDQARSQYVLLFLMEALCRVNQSLLRQNRLMIDKKMIGEDERIPELYRAGIHYEREQPGQEEWPDIVHMLKKAGQEFPGPWADCEDLACWRVAELRELAEHIDPTTGKKKKGGMKARPFAKWRRGPSGAFHYHALVLLPDGKIEDPSLVLGMGKERLFAERDIANRLKRGELDPKIQYAIPPEVMVADIESPTGFNDRKRDPKGIIGVPGKAAEFAIRDPLLETLMGALGPVCGMAGPAVVDDAQPTVESLRAAAPDPISAAASLLGGSDPMAAAASLLGADPMAAAAASMPESAWAPSGPDALVTESSIAPLRADVAQISSKVNPPPEPFVKGFVKRTARTEIQRVLQRAVEVLMSRF